MKCRIFDGDSAQGRFGACVLTEGAVGEGELEADVVKIGAHGEGALVLDLRTFGEALGDPDVAYLHVHVGDFSADEGVDGVDFVVGAGAGVARSGCFCADAGEGFFVDFTGAIVFAEFVEDDGEGEGGVGVAGVDGEGLFKPGDGLLPVAALMGDHAEHVVDIGKAARNLKYGAELRLCAGVVTGGEKVFSEVEMLLGVLVHGELSAGVSGSV